MKMLNLSKTMAILIVTILTISTGTSMLILPNVNAHSPPLNIPTYTFCNVGTNPVGVGQTVNIGMWLGQPPPTANGPYGDRWQNITLKVTLPDTTTQTLGPFTSDDTGGTYTPFTPVQLGVYTFQATFGGQTLTGDNLAHNKLAHLLAIIIKPALAVSQPLPCSKNRSKEFQSLRFRQTTGRPQ